MRTAGSLERFVRDEQAGTAIEYGLICALVVLAAMTALILFADEVKAIIDYVSTRFVGAAQGAG